MYFLKFLTTVFSPEFRNLLLYPKGNLKGKDNSLSLYLSVADCTTLRGNWKFYAKFKLRVMDQVQGEHQEGESEFYFYALSYVQ